jgi:hypothetical protein
MRSQTFASSSSTGRRWRLEQTGACVATTLDPCDERMTRDTSLVVRSVLLLIRVNSEFVGDVRVSRSQGSGLYFCISHSRRQRTRRGDAGVPKTEFAPN